MAGKRTNSIDMAVGARIQARLSERLGPRAAAMNLRQRGAIVAFDLPEAGGYLASQKTALTDSNSSIDRQIEDIERRLTQRKAVLDASFIAMETAQSKIQQMQTQITNMMSSLSSSSSSK